MKTVETFDYMNGTVTLQQNEKSNVIGKGGWSVRVSAPFVTKQLNYTNEYDALVRYNEECLNLIIES